jgi:hypothetical protein
MDKKIQLMLYYGGIYMEEQKDNVQNKSEIKASKSKKNIKWIILIGIILIAIASYCLYSYFVILKPNTEGNTLGNITNSGVVSKQGIWIYYQNYMDKKLYKKKINGKDKVKLSDDSIAYINVVGDWIYYSNWSDNYHITKVKTDGSSKTTVGNDRTAYINVVDDWIYYRIGVTDRRYIKSRLTGQAELS